MPADTSVDKSVEELRSWGHADPRGLADDAFGLQAEVRRLRDAAAQNSSNNSQPASTDRPEKPKPKSLRQKSGRKPGGQPGHPGRTLEFCQFSSYLGFENCLHTFCKPHLMREVIFLFEPHDQNWAKALHDLFLEMRQHVKEPKALVQSFPR